MIFANNNDFFFKNLPLAFSSIESNRNCAEVESDCFSLEQIRAKRNNINAKLTEQSKYH
jgi:hypothetical protein